MRPRLIEGICGALAALWGLLVEGYLLFGSSYAFAGSSSGGITTGSGGGTTTGHTGLVGIGITPATIVSLSILTLLLIVIGIMAVLDSRGSGTPVFRVLLITTTVLLAMYSCLALLSIGVLLLPSLVLAIIAVVFGSISGGPGTRQRPSRS